MHCISPIFLSPKNKKARDLSEAGFLPKFLLHVQIRISADPLQYVISFFKVFISSMVNSLRGTFNRSRYDFHVSLIKAPFIRPLIYRHYYTKIEHVSYKASCVIFSVEISKCSSWNILIDILFILADGIEQESKSYNPPANSANIS